MSLIQQALKRKSEEIPPDVPPQIQTPDRMAPPTEVVEASVSKSPQPLLVLLIIVLVIALLIALGGLVFSLIRHPTLRSPVIQPPRVVELSESGPEVSPLPPTEEAPAIETPVSPETPPLTEPSITIQETTAPDISEGWPELDLTGIASSGAQRIAIINGKMLTAGRAIGEVIVLEVNSADAVVEFQGQRRILHVDE
jgi:hypothetical protein